MREYIAGNDDMDRPIEHVPGSMEDFLRLRDLPGFCAPAT